MQSSIVSKPKLGARSAAIRAKAISSNNRSIVVARAAARSEDILKAGASVALSAALAFTLSVAPAQAVGLESVDILPSLQSMNPSEVKEKQDVQRQKLQEVDENFQNCE